MVASASAVVIYELSSSDKKREGGLCVWLHPSVDSMRVVLVVCYHHLSPVCVYEYSPVVVDELTDAYSRCMEMRNTHTILKRNKNSRDVRAWPSLSANARKKMQGK